MNTLETLRAAYLAAFSALVAKYPAQEQNRYHHEGWSSSARRGFTVKRITTKGGFTDIPAGTVVLYLEDELEDGAGRDWISVWAPRPDGMPTRTLVAATAVIEVVPTGYRHPDGLVTLTGSK